MSILSVLNPYIDGETLTSSNLNNLVNEASFASDSVDNITTQLGGASGGSIVVCDNAIDRTKLKSELQGALELQSSGGGYVGGIKTGTGFGTDSLTISTIQTSSAYVASGLRAVAIGNNIQATGNYSIAYGYDAQAEADYAVAVGSDAEAIGTKSVALGYNVVANHAPSSAIGVTGSSIAIGIDANANAGCVSIGKNNDSYGNTDDGGATVAIGINNTCPAGSFQSSAIGVGNTAGGIGGSAFGLFNVNSSNDSIIFGNYVQNTGNNKVELGHWSQYGTGRECSLNMQASGQVAFTMNSSDTPPTDGGATEGAEGAGTLARGMYTIQKNTSDAVTMYFNDAGTIKTLSLGTLS